MDHQEQERHSQLVQLPIGQMHVSFALLVVNWFKNMSVKVVDWSESCSQWHALRKPALSFSMKSTQLEALEVARYALSAIYYTMAPHYIVRFIG